MPYILRPPNLGRRYLGTFDVTSNYFYLHTPPPSPTTSSTQLDAQIIEDWHKWGWCIWYRFAHSNPQRARMVDVQERNGGKKRLLEVWRKQKGRWERKERKKEEYRRMGVPMGWRANLKAMFLNRWPRGDWQRGAGATGRRMDRRANSRGAESVRSVSSSSSEESSRRAGDKKRKLRRTVSAGNVDSISMETVSLKGSFTETLKSWQRLKKGGDSHDEHMCFLRGEGLRGPRGPEEQVSEVTGKLDTLSIRGAGTTEKDRRDSAGSKSSDELLIEDRRGGGTAARRHSDGYPAWP